MLVIDLSYRLATPAGSYSSSSASYGFALLQQSSLGYSLTNLSSLIIELASCRHRAHALFFPIALTTLDRPLLPLYPLPTLAHQTRSFEIKALRLFCFVHGSNNETSFNHLPSLIFVARIALMGSNFHYTDEDQLDHPVTYCSHRISGL